MDQPYVKTIGGKKYLYVVESVYIDRGNIKQKYKSLGRVGRSFDIGRKWGEFRDEIIAFEAEERAAYWGKRVKNPKAFGYVPVKKLEELRARLYRGKEDLKMVGMQAMETAFTINFIYNSNKIEGSRLPMKAVEDKVKIGGKGNNEVANTISAIEFFNDQSLPCSTPGLIEGQKILMAHESSKQGLRKEDYVIGDSDVVDYKEIRPELKKLQDWYKVNEYKMYPPELAFLFHYRFERIHPFPDGNGRIGRILMNAILKKHRYHPIIVWDTKRVSYFSSFKKGMGGRMDDFIKFMAEQYVDTYRIYINKIGKASSIDEQLLNFLNPHKKG